MKNLSGFNFLTFLTWLMCTKYSTKGKEWTNPNFFSLPWILTGHKPFKPRCRTAARKTFFSNRIIDEWNRLPQCAIDSSSVNVFKNRLDETREDMGGIYNQGWNCRGGGGGGGGGWTPSSCLETPIFEWKSALNFNPWAKFLTFRQLPPQFI